MLNAGKSYIEHIQQAKIQQYVNSKHRRHRLRRTERRRRHHHLRSDAARRREPDLRPTWTPASRSTRTCKRASSSSCNPRHPGTTEELLLPILEKSGLKCPIAAGPDAENVPGDFFLAFSPEREIPGNNKQYGLAQIPKVVGGANPPSGRAAVALYTPIVAKVVPVSSTRAAEMAKLLENIFRCVNIALVNAENAQPCGMGVDIWEVVDAAAKPFGFMPFYPGPGLGGHCIPVDPFYLSWKAREYDFAALSSNSPAK